MNSIETGISSADDDIVQDPIQERAMSLEQTEKILDVEPPLEDSELTTFDKKEKDKESCNLQSKANAKQVEANKSNVEALNIDAAVKVCKQQEKDILPGGDSAQSHPTIPAISVTTPQGIEEVTDVITSSLTTQAEVETHPYNSSETSLNNQNTAISQSSLAKDDTLNRGSLISEITSEHTEPPVTSGQEGVTNDASEKSLCGKTSSGSLQFKSSDLSVSLDSQSVNLPKQNVGENNVADKENTQNPDKVDNVMTVLQDSTTPALDTRSGDCVPKVIIQGNEKSPAGADGEGFKSPNILSHTDKLVVENNSLVNQCEDACQAKEKCGGVSEIIFIENRTLTTDEARKENIEQLFYNQKSISEDMEKHSFDCNNSHIDEEEYLLAEAESMFFAEFGKEAITSPPPNNSPTSKSTELIGNSNGKTDNQAPAENSTSVAKIARNKRIMLSEWVAAKPFQPRTSPAVQTDQVCHEHGAQYFNNNNCHNRSTTKIHIASGKFGEYADNSESLDHSGEENSQDDVLDIIVLPDNQDKQTHPQQQLSGRNASAPRFHTATSQFRPRTHPYPPHNINRFGFPPNNNCRFASTNLPLPPPHISHHSLTSVTSAFSRATIPPHFAGVQLRAAVNHTRLSRYTQMVSLPSPAPAFSARFPSSPTVPISSLPLTSTLQIPPFNSLPFATHVPTPKEFLNPPKLCSVRDGVVPYQEIDGCCYFDPSYVPDKPPPGLQYGYPQRGKRRKAMRLSSRFPTQAGKFHHHANFYVRSCAETVLGQGEDNSSN